ncbi:MAG: GNAT family N-acetyltransferase [Flavobacteriales bacterium]|nr:GNAT family N-acetyltransferase [Flavobacteriales bacterium]MBL6873697.1 GNAT family N-acetyltransferase [Flavobacteriales bacterium]
MDFEIKLQPLNENDSKELLQLFTNEKVLQSYSESLLPKPQQIDDFIQQITTEGCWTWKIIKDDDSNQFLGICSLHHYDNITKSIEIGGTLLSEYWGKGIMITTFQELINQAKKDFDINRIIGKTLPDNKRALSLVKKLGFSVFFVNENETVVVKDLVEENSI